MTVAIIILASLFAIFLFLFIRLRKHYYWLEDDLFNAREAIQICEKQRSALFEENEEMIRLVKEEYKKLNELIEKSNELRDQDFEYMTSMYNSFQIILGELNRIDYKNWFKNDDEVGWLWTEIKTTIKNYQDIFTTFANDYNQTNTQAQEEKGEANQSEALLDADDGKRSLFTSTAGE